MGKRGPKPKKSNAAFALMRITLKIATPRKTPKRYK